MRCKGSQLSNKWIRAKGRYSRGNGCNVRGAVRFRRKPDKHRGWENWAGGNAKGRAGREGEAWAYIGLIWSGDKKE